ncbi:MAG: ATP-binding protein [Actinobacteria bacterium]|nr:ATP-binding protein [Actinomycetota bacterium]
MPLPPGSDAPALARDYLSRRGAHLPSDLLDDALVIVSELVTNAVRHGRPEIVLSVREEPPGIGVAVQDSGPELPQWPVHPPADDDPHGRGLLIVDALASRWGVEPNPGGPGKTVWFELRPLPS